MSETINSIANEYKVDESFQLGHFVAICHIKSGDTST